MDAATPLKWTYELKNQSDDNVPDWVEVFEATYEDKPVDVVVRVGVHPIIKQDFDGLFLRIYSDASKKDFIGLVAATGRPDMTNFTKPLEGRVGTTTMDSGEAPNLGDFVKQYRAIFVSQRDLKETYKRFL